MKINCVLIDDEPLALDLLKAHLTQFKEYEVLKTFTNALDAGEFLKSNTIDVVFIDIEMPLLKGIDFVKSIQNPPIVVFTTAYANYAVQGFEINALDYLLKPITFERFYNTIQRINARFEQKQTENKNEFILVKTENKLVSLLQEDILFVEAMHKYVKIQTNEKRYVSLIGISYIEKELNNFFRVHKSFLVNLSKITAIEGNEVLIMHYRIPISRGNKELLLAKMGKRIG